MSKMRRGFSINGQKFSYIPVKNLDLNKLKLSPEKFRYNYLKIACAFDIETTSYYSKKYDKDLATMYIWQLSLDYDTIIGRTWEEFIRVIEALNDYAAKHDGVILCLIQNLSFEFQFIKSLFQWNLNREGYPDIFAKDDRTILYAKYKNIEFRDTLALTGMGLARFKKNYGLSVDKLVGDLDYSLYRHSKTPVTNKELAYCINDVQILSDFFYKYLFPEYIKPGKKIPLTSTGIVRNDIKESFMELPKEERKKIQNRIRNSQPTEAVYKLWRNYLFRGGLVHASTIACNYIWDASETGPFGSYDLKSAHPSNMFKKFPWKYNRRKVEAWEEVLKAARTGDYSFFGVFKFYNIRCSGYHSLESKNKIIEASPDAIYENGRLVFASYIKVCLLCQDFFNYEDLYEWERFQVTVLYQAKLEPLPEYIRKVICKYFVIKETAESDSPERNAAKRKVNGIFGMLATGLPEREVVFNQDTNEMEMSANSKTYNELIQYLIMLPQWSIMTAAYTRRSIVQSIKACGFDSMYYDTDSNKIMNFEAHKGWFDKFNEERVAFNKTINTFGYDKKYFERLGCFELEYVGSRFKVLGAKRYLVEHDGKTQVTVAGMVKGSLEAYCEKNKLDIWEIFDDNLKLPAGDSWKKTTVYYDQAFEDKLTDYTGQTETINEGSCVAIIDIPFTMSLEEEFINRIETLREERERMIYKGVF